MNRKSQPSELKVTCVLASQSLYTHKWSPGEYKERGKRVQKLKTLQALPCYFTSRLKDEALVSQGEG